MGILGNIWHSSRKMGKSTRKNRIFPRKMRLRRHICAYICAYNKVKPGPQTADLRHRRQLGATDGRSGPQTPTKGKIREAR